jgi:hypothetical protein
MRRAQNGRRSRGIALFEVALVVCIVGLAAAIASLLATDSRRRARLGGSIQNLKQLGDAYSGFAADHSNRVATFDWAPGETHTCGSLTFPVATTYNEAAANQAVCILRERAGRTEVTQITGWFPHLYYSNLVLIDYLDDSLPGAALVSPGDSPRLAWRRAALSAEGPAAYFTLSCRPSGSSANDIRWAYSSSYEIQPSFISPDAIMNGPNGSVPTVAQDPSGHRFFQLGTAQTVLGNRRMDEVRHPSRKAMMYESNQRFFGPRELFFMYSEARVPILLADGSSVVRSMSRANPGFQPNTPQSLSPTRIPYSPELSWETPTASGAASEFVNGLVRWTRSGLRGRDFAGAEVPWVP